MTALLFALFLQQANAAELAGVTVPDTATVGGQTLVLNGVGLREKFYFDIYVGALYLPAKTTSGPDVIAQDVPKRIEMTFIYSAVTTAQLCETYDEDLQYMPDPAGVKDRFETLKSYMSDVVAGDKITYDYVPGIGTSVTVKGVNKGVIAGKDFAEALFTIYVGSHPPTGNLKKGMLGG